MINRHKKIDKLRKQLDKVAFISLLADIAISAVTIASIYMGEFNAVGILFIINYLLIVIVIISLFLMASIFVLSHYHKLSRIIGLFEFKVK